MGIYNRDYIREEPSSFGGYGGSSSQWALKYILIANIVVFVLQMMSGQVRGNAFVGGITQWLSLELTDLYSFQIWRLITYGFCHSADIWHLAINMFILWMFGRIIEPIYGAREFLAFYLIGILISGLGHVGFQLVQASPAGVVGASGGVMAVVFLTAMNYPRMQVLLFFVIPIELRWVALLYAFADVAGLLGPGESGVAHAAHLGGAAFGVLYHYYNWRIMPFVYHWVDRFRAGRLRHSRPHVRIHRPSEKQQIDEQVDAILQKISEQGEESLSDRERKILKDASRRYKKSP